MHSCVLLCFVFKFMQDCSDVMQLLLKTQTEWSDLPEDDPQVRACSSACETALNLTSLCTCIQSIHHAL